MFDNMRHKLFSEEDDEQTRRRIEAKRERLAASGQRPILPGMSTAFYFMTLGSALCTACSETIMWQKLGMYGLEKYLQNLSVSLLGFWLIFGFVTVALSYARFYALRYKNAPALKPTEHAVPFWNRGWKKRSETPRRYVRRCLVVLGGAVIFLIFYLLVWNL